MTSGWEAVALEFLHGQEFQELGRAEIPLQAEEVHFGYLETGVVSKVVIRYGDLDILEIPFHRVVFQGEDLTVRIDPEFWRKL